MIRLLNFHSLGAVKSRQSPLLRVNHPGRVPIEVLATVVMNKTPI